MTSGTLHRWLNEDGDYYGGLGRCLAVFKSVTHDERMGLLKELAAFVATQAPTHLAPHFKDLDTKLRNMMR